MQYHIGCSGWSYTSWQGPFYPQNLTNSGWLNYYSHVFDYVEIDSSFYDVFTKERPIPSISDSVLSRYDSLYYHHKGTFKIDKPVSEPKSDTIVTMLTDVSCRTLLLDCSLRFFSEGTQADGTFSIHSGNYRFFSGEIELYFETVFMLLNSKENKLIGTPLFLKLSVEKDEEAMISL